MRLVQVGPGRQFVFGMDNAAYLEDGVVDLPRFHVSTVFRCIHQSETAETKQIEVKNLLIGTFWLLPWN